MHRIPGETGFWSSIQDGGMVLLEHIIFLLRIALTLLPSVTSSGKWTKDAIGGMQGLLIFGAHLLLSRSKSLCGGFRWDIAGGISFQAWCTRCPMSTLCFLCGDNASCLLVLLPYSKMVEHFVSLSHLG
ncbi:hypothetical protein KP509_30G040200 [Ceratopteris richardii]|uniref:Uncharacterized protein n=1 Tax=Ceratopteris richardii TaxID=49495 RepID=A0A8T2R2Q4_CERRI|nr:hypothetical protein KP509_30G040200 [Ceratopteris richardii]